MQVHWWNENLAQAIRVPLGPSDVIGFFQQSCNESGSLKKQMEGFCTRYMGFSPQLNGRCAIAGELGDGRVATVGTFLDTQTRTHDTPNKVTSAHGKITAKQTPPSCTTGPCHRWYVQIKGTGRNPLTEDGKDGWATLAECLRERDASELLAAKGIPTSRVLAIVCFKQFVRRRVIRRDLRNPGGGPGSRPHPRGKPPRGPLEQSAAVIRLVPDCMWRVGSIEYLFYHDHLDFILSIAEDVDTLPMPATNAMNDTKPSTSGAAAAVSSSVAKMFEGANGHAPFRLRPGDLVCSVCYVACRVFILTQ